MRDVSKPNSYLKEVTVQTTREGLCQRFFADANGWMIIPLPYNRGGFAFYGFETSQWPKDSFVEVAQISQRGRGKIVPVMVKNPKKQGPSRAVCNTILALGTVKETLKAATNWVAGSLPNPAAKLIAGEVVSLYFDAIDPPNPLDAPTLKTTAKFALPEKAADFARVLRPYGYTVVQKKDMVMWEKVGQVVLFAELGVGLHSVWRDYKTVCK